MTIKKDYFNDRDPERGNKPRREVKKDRSEKRIKNALRSGHIEDIIEMDDMEDRYNEDDRY